MGVNIGGVTTGYAPSCRACRATVTRPISSNTASHPAVSRLILISYGRLFHDQIRVVALSEALAARAVA